MDIEGPFHKRVSQRKNFVELGYFERDVQFLLGEEKEWGIGCEYLIFV